MCVTAAPVALVVAVLVLAIVRSKTLSLTFCFMYC